MGKGIWTSGEGNIYFKKNKNYATNKLVKIIIYEDELRVREKWYSEKDNHFIYVDRRFKKLTEYYDYIEKNKNYL